MLDAVCVIKADDIVNPLVGDDATHEQDIRTFVGEIADQRVVGGLVEVGEAWYDREHARAREAELLQFLAVELGIAQGQVAAVDIRAQLSSAAVALPHEILVDPDEVLRRRNVVIDEHHAVG